MLTISLTSLIEEAANSSELVKHHSGNVLEPDKLFDRASLDALERAHPGVFGFVAFDPKVDKSIKQYVESGVPGKR